MRLFPKDPISSLKRTPVGENLRRVYEERTADAWLLSFPKCGRTWLRVMMGRAFQQHFDLQHPRIERRLLKLHRLHKLNPDVPKIWIDHDDFPHWKKPDELRHEKKRYARGDVIFLVRDPRDVIVSFYFEQSRRLTDEDARRILQRHPSLKPWAHQVKPYTGTMKEFIREEAGSFDTLLEYYNIWAHNRDVPRAFLLMKYEDLRRETAAELRRLMDFLNLNEMRDEVITEAVEYSRFENMRKMEAENTFHSGKLAPKDKSDVSTYKTRKGKVGGYREELDAEDVQWLDQRMREKLDPWFGYG